MTVFLLVSVLLSVEAQVMPGSQATEVAATSWVNTDGFSMEAARGGVVVLFFWASTCEPCVEAIPAISDLAAEYADREVTFVGLTNEDGSEVDLELFITERGLSFPVGIGSMSYQDYGVTVIPHAFVVNPAGVVVWRGHPLGELEEVLATVVGEGNYEVVGYEEIALTEVTPGETVEGSLSEEDFNFIGTYTDGYKLANVVAGEYVITVTSEEIDTTLYVRTAMGDAKELRNDDAAPDFALPSPTDSAVSVYVDSGDDIMVYVSSYYREEIGAYTINVTRR